MNCNCVALLILYFQIWETKLLQSRAVDTGEPPQTHHVQSYREIQEAAEAAKAQAKEEAKVATQQQQQQHHQQQGEN